MKLSWFLLTLLTLNKNNAEDCDADSDDLLCFCDNGQTSPICSKTESPLDKIFAVEFCISCDTGFNLVDEKCVKNSIPAASNSKQIQIAKFEARTNKKIKSSSNNCPTGFYQRGNRCIKNKCLCENGNPASGPNCVIDGSIKCKSCRAGFTLDSYSNQCLENKCHCTNGTPIKYSKECSGGGRRSKESCQFCDSGYYLTNDNRCLMKKCQCLHGRPATGVECPENNKVKCKSCWAGYTMNVSIGYCLKTDCKCENGTPIKNSKDCECQSCDFGYELVGGICKKEQEEEGEKIESKNTIEIGNSLASDELIITENKCICENGNPAKGQNCNKNGLLKCRSCYAGYSMDGISNTCIQNKCSCANGTPLTNSKDCKNNREICESCDEGFHLSNTKNNQCLENVCKCARGNPAKGINCPIDGYKKCRSCYAGFDLTADYQCVENRCVCSNGRV